MKLVKVGRKWMVEREGERWVFNRIFPSKWKAEIALQVYHEGGRTSDYWVKSREYVDQNPKPVPMKARAKVEEALEKIETLDPTCEEIEEYATKEAGYGEVTVV